MKIIKEIGLECYEIDDFNEDSEAFSKIVGEHINFLLEVFPEQFEKEIEEADRMRTPWFINEIVYENHKDYIIDSIRENNYLFDETGDILPIRYEISTINGRYDIIDVLFHGKPITLENAKNRGDV